MIRKLKIIAVITARGGSKGLPYKNIAKIGNKPLIYYTIKAALGTKLINKVILSTDSSKIASISKKYGVEIPFLRPKKLATDTAHHPDVVEHAVNYVEKKRNFFPDIVIMLQPTSPFRTSKHLTFALKKFVKEKNESLIGVRKQNYPPWWMFKISNKKLETNFKWKNKNVFNMERQEFPNLYRPNGAIYITYRKSLKIKKNLVNPKSCGYYLMSDLESIDIDNKLDLEIAKKILKK